MQLSQGLNLIPQRFTTLHKFLRGFASPGQVVLERSFFYGECQIPGDATEGCQGAGGLVSGFSELYQVAIVCELLYVQHMLWCVFKERSDKSLKDLMVSATDGSKRFMVDELIRDNRATELFLW